eukprot:TRINITY_DN12279_c0_g1_i1.p1 TRINITY_DN12279_c0_g1~~TRINITY_DN12279_c0_g1_i1.p1  ORF type:complete len:212 (-),score=40.41 TRINITY_DN12279_c0_g1_i1:249-884(-)
MEQHRGFKDIESIVQFILSGECKKVVFLTGAGVSVAAGIPDFRSPGGMYDTLRPHLLTATPGQRKAMQMDPTHVVSWDLFSENQLPYLELRRPFILGLAEKKWKATIAHWFVQLCYDHDILQRLYTQNIDGFDYQTNVPKEKVVGVHGSLGRVLCEFCKTEYSLQDFTEKVFFFEDFFSFTWGFFLFLSFMRIFFSFTWGFFFSFTWGFFF